MREQFEGAAPAVVAFAAVERPVGVELFVEQRDEPFDGPAASCAKVRRGKTNARNISKVADLRAGGEPLSSAQHQQAAF